MRDRKKREREKDWEKDGERSIQSVKGQISANLPKLSQTI